MSRDEPRQRPIQLTVASDEAGQRLDVFLANQCPDYSRVQLRRAIVAGEVLVDDRRAKPAFRLSAAQRVTMQPLARPAAGPSPENIPLDVLYEDEHLIAINKPPGMVVHPSKGHWSGTLTSALAYHFQQLSGAGGTHRPGIVHRLDRDTSGVLVVAKSDRVHLQLASQFENRSTQKEYFAIVAGVPDRDRDWIEQPIGIHPYQREKMAIRAGHSSSREAATFYEVNERFRGFASLKVTPKTGRTHQIRLHLAHIGCPVLCDRLYGGRSELSAGELTRETGGNEDVRLLNRQALHASRLTIAHPVTEKPTTFVAELPEDLEETLNALRENCE